MQNLILFLPNVHKRSKFYTVLWYPYLKFDKPDYIKDSETLDLFRSKIRKWNPINCPLHVAFAKKCIPNLHFINQICFYIVAYDLVDITKDV